MDDGRRRALLGTPLVLVLGALLALAGSHHGQVLGSVPLFALAVAAAFVVQWVAFVPAYVRRTETWFDLTGSLTYVTVTVALLALTPERDARGMLLAALVVVWALRLGPFVFRRVRRAGSDDRFDEIKQSAPRFLLVWTVQGLWVTFTAMAAWVGITSTTRTGFDALAVVGLVVWLAGFATEAVADAQKTRFRADPANAGRFISTGLWSRSRHPNYLGEIVLWTGVAIVAAPVLSGWQWVALVSPVFVTALLTRVSGIPLLERKADARWGDDPAYQAYTRTTPVLVPRLRPTRTPVG
jgi:steroid 5-alpha reductase family enzyme